MKQKKIKPLSVYAYRHYALRSRSNVRRAFFPGLQEDQYYSLNSLESSVEYWFGHMNRLNENKLHRLMAQSAFKISERSYHRTIKGIPNSIRYAHEKRYSIFIKE